MDVFTYKRHSPRYRTSVCWKPAPLIVPLMGRGLVDFAAAAKSAIRMSSGTDTYGLMPMICNGALKIYINGEVRQASYRIFTGHGLPFPILRGSLFPTVVHRNV